MHEPKERVYSRIEPSILETVDALAEKQGGTRSGVLNFLLRHAITEAYSSGLRFLLVRELEQNHLGRKYSPEELDVITREIQARSNFDDVVILGLLPERR